jgi:peptide/nickel transport system ATP-binding protein
MEELDEILKVEGLQTHFTTNAGLVKAVDDISFSVKRGETLGIVGESGSGKSVSALSIMRLVPKPAGQIVGGKLSYTSPHTAQKYALLDCSEQEMQGIRGNEIAMIFQEPMTSLNPVFSCGDQVAEALQLHQGLSTDQAKEKVLQLFEKVRLPDVDRMYNAYPHQLSGGQKQRVMIAMALSCNPGLLIADEPTTALDVTVQKATLDLMNELKEEFGMAILFITHDLGVIAEIADRVLVMYKGKIVESGTVEAIFKNPQHPYTKGLLSCRPPLDYRLKRLPVVTDFMEVNGNTAEVSVKEKSLSEVILSAKVSNQEIAKRIEALQKQDPFLSVKDLKTWFPAKKNWLGQVQDYVKAVDEVSFDIFPGETLGLVGESGCGKTTLGRTLLGLTPSNGGEVLYKGVNLLNYSPKAWKPIRRDMQIIFQDPYSSLNPRMTIGNAIMEPMRTHKILENDKVRKERVIELLETVSLSADHFNRYPHEFSGGQRQRICIARALALNPKFIICDESVSALDVSVQAQVLNLLMELREQFGLTYIFISHDLSVVKFMSDRMIVMNKGKIEEMGEADEIYSNPQREYTQKLIAAIPKGII